VWVWTVSLPVTILNSPGVTRWGQPRFGTGRDIAGVILYTTGLVMESVSDAQKYRFRSAHGSDGAVCKTGLFSWSRHPNYFGEIIVQFGKLFLDYQRRALIFTAIYMIAVSPAASGYTKGGAFDALYASIVGPVLLTVLLLFVSGLTLQERPSAKKRFENGIAWPAYAEWLHRTSILIPCPPYIYSRLPTFLKCSIFLEFPMYVFDPEKHADTKTVSRVEQGETGRSHNESE
jgi:steroid 5-alpha reductase family enzyme